MLKKINIIKITCAITLSPLLFPLILKGDVYIKRVKHYDPVSIIGHTEPAKDEEGGTWISKDKYRVDDGEKSTVIIRLDQRKAYIINHQTKTYSEADIPVDLKKILCPQATKFIENLVVSSHVSDTGEMKKIKKWKCKKYVIEIDASVMGIEVIVNQELWVSKKFAVRMNLYKKFEGELLGLNPLVITCLEEMKKIEGYPVLIKSSVKMIGAEKNSIEEVISVEKKSPPPGIYDLPQGYTKSGYNPFPLEK